MSDEPVTKRNCLRCGASFFDDMNSFCPHCDAATVGTNGHPDAPVRVLAMRQGYQADLKARWDKEHA